MKVILKQDIKGVGKKDEIINASDGYAKNFLFPKKLAVLADKTNMGELKSKKDSEEYRKEEERKKAIMQKEKIEKDILQIKVKTGENGKLFGSITSKEIAENLETQYKIKIDKKKITMDSIKTLGTYTVNIKLFEGIKANLKIMIME